MYYVYVLYSKKFDKFYIGFTEDLLQRLSEHKRNNVWTTMRMQDFELAYYEVSRTKKDATIRERQLKTGFGRSYLRRRLVNYLGG
ncbi:MAG: GIY-YIG nuclease family protein [bacterium]|nr:GIY-YIG nuclease family protein [bacterium]